MRVKLREGKQKELIFLAKGDKTWNSLGNLLKINPFYLCGDLKNEYRVISENLYKNLCKIADVNFDEYVVKKLEDNWGQSKGGINSPGSRIFLPKIKFCDDLAEFVGVVLGDGHVCFIKGERYKKKIGTYVIRIAGDLNKDREYHLNYLKIIGKKLFNLDGSEVLKINQNERFLDFYSLELVNFFSSMDIKPGNKITNQSTIPKWIYSKKSYLQACLRGLIDTDGCIHRMSNKDPHLLRINFTSHNHTLLKDVRNGFIKLGFHPSKVILDAKFFISRQSEIKKFVEEIGFKNQRHIKRLKEFSPVV